VFVFFSLSFKFYWLTLRPWSEGRLKRDWPQGRAAADVNRESLVPLLPRNSHLTLQWRLSVQDCILLKDLYSHRFIPFLSEGHMCPKSSRVTANGHQATGMSVHVKRYPVCAVYCGYVSKSHLLTLQKEMPSLAPVPVCLCSSETLQ